MLLTFLFLSNSFLYTIFRLLLNRNVLRVAKLIISNWLISKAEKLMNEHFSAPGYLASQDSCSQTKSRSLSYQILSMPYRTLSHAGPSPQPQPSYVAGPGDLPQHEHDQPAEGLIIKITITIIIIMKVYLNNCSLHAVDKTAFRSLTLMIELDLSDNKVGTIKEN